MGVRSHTHLLFFSKSVFAFQDPHIQPSAPLARPAHQARRSGAELRARHRVDTSAPVRPRVAVQDHCTKRSTPLRIIISSRRHQRRSLCDKEPSRLAHAQVLSCSPCPAQGQSRRAEPPPRALAPSARRLGWPFPRLVHCLPQHAACCVIQGFCCPSLSLRCRADPGCHAQLHAHGASLPPLPHHRCRKRARSSPARLPSCTAHPVPHGATWAGAATLSPTAHRLRRERARPPPPEPPPPRALCAPPTLTVLPQHGAHARTRLAHLTASAHCAPIAPIALQV